MKLDADQVERLRIMKELDVDAALARSPFQPDTREIALAGLHKARIQSPRSLFTRAERELSRNWLRSHHFEEPKQNRATR